MHLLRSVRCSQRSLSNPLRAVPSAGPLANHGLGNPIAGENVWRQLSLTPKRPSAEAPVEGERPKSDPSALRRRSVELVSRQGQMMTMMDYAAAATAEHEENQRRTRSLSSRAFARLAADPVSPTSPEARESPPQSARSDGMGAVSEDDRPVHPPRQRRSSLKGTGGVDGGVSPRSGRFDGHTTPPLMSSLKRRVSFSDELSAQQKLELQVTVHVDSVAITEALPC